MTYKVPVCVRDAYTIYWQDIEGSCWAHCDVRKWSASICKRLRADFDTLRELRGSDVFALNEPTGDRKHQRFLRMMGFEFFKAFPAKDGGECLIFRREKHGT